VKNLFISLLNNFQHHDSMKCRIVKHCESNHYAIYIRQDDLNIEHYFCINLVSDRNVDEQLKNFQELDGYKELIYARSWLDSYCLYNINEPIERVNFSPLCNQLEQLTIPNARFVINFKINNPISEIEVTFRTESNDCPAKFEYSNEGVKNACDFMYSKLHINDKTNEHSQ